MTDSARDLDLTSWVARLLERPELLGMGHNQRALDANLGLGWLYHAFGRIIRPRTAVVIGSYRGFVPLILARALQENREPGDVVFIEPSLLDDFWRNEAEVAEYFRSFGLENVRHFRMTTQEFAETETYAELDGIGLLFVDGYHSAEQARFDYQAFEKLLGPRGLVLFHDSMIVRKSEKYGAERAYDIGVKHFLDELRKDPSLELFDIPFGTGLTLLRKLGEGSSEPLLEKDPHRKSPGRA